MDVGSTSFLFGFAFFLLVFEGKGVGGTVENNLKCVHMCASLSLSLSRGKHMCNESCINYFSVKKSGFS